MEIYLVKVSEDDEEGFRTVCVCDSYDTAVKVAKKFEARETAMTMILWSTVVTDPDDVLVLLDGSAEILSHRRR